MALHIVSGGQTGVDRAALDAAQAAGLTIGGWCPRGRRAEDGPIAAAYPLKETPSDDYVERTEWNVRDSDGTLIVARGDLTGGTALTARLARRYRRPLLVVDPLAPGALAAARRWLAGSAIEVLNVAGPRGSRGPEIYAEAKAFLASLFSPPDGFNDPT